jgi:hypothetical protein
MLKLTKRCKFVKFYIILNSSVIKLQFKGAKLMALPINVKSLRIILQFLKFFISFCVFTVFNIFLFFVCVLQYSQF